MGRSRVERAQQQLRSALCAGDVAKAQQLLGFEPDAAGAVPPGSSTLWRRLTTMFSASSACARLDYQYSDDLGALPVMYLATGRLVAASGLEDAPAHDSCSTTHHHHRHHHHHYAEAGGAGARAACLAWLLSCPALAEQLDLSRVTHRCENVLHCALLNRGSLEVVQLLLGRAPQVLPAARLPGLVLEDAQGDTPLDYALASGNWPAAELLLRAGALGGWGALCRQREAQLLQGLEPAGPPGAGWAQRGGGSASTLVGLPLPLPLGRQLEVAAGLLQKAAARLPSGLARWGQWVASWAAPGDAATRAIEEEVAAALEAGKASGASGGGGAPAVSMDAVQVVAAMRAAVAQVADVLQVDVPTAMSLLAEHAYDVDATLHANFMRKYAHAPPPSPGPAASPLQRPAAAAVGASGSQAAAAGPLMRGLMSTVGVSGGAGEGSEAALGAAQVSAGAGMDTPFSQEQQQGPCTVCDERAPATSFTVVMPCGHATCDNCWRGILRARLDDGNPQRARCPVPECQLPLPPEGAQAVLAPAEWERAARLLAAHYVEVHAASAWCPRAGCGRSVRVVVQPGDAGRAGAALKARRGLCAQCACGARFCFECGGPPHEPASCEQVRAWRELTAAEAASAEARSLAYLRTTTKPCPRCRTPVVKDGGCNHMVCSRCSAHWCWVCGGDWAQHNAQTGGYYRCNRAVEAPPGNTSSSSRMRAGGAADAGIGTIGAGSTRTAQLSLAQQHRLRQCLTRYLAYEGGEPRLAARLGRMAWLHVLSQGTALGVAVQAAPAAPRAPAVPEAARTGRGRPGAPRSRSYAASSAIPGWDARTEDGGGLAASSSMGALQGAATPHGVGGGLGLQGPGSVRTGGSGSVMGDGDKDLEIQVLLADREVLQDQVVAVEMANERLITDNEALAAECARLRLEHEKERRIVRELESDMVELRRFKNAREAEAERLRSELATARGEAPPGGGSAGGSVMQPGAASTVAAMLEAGGIAELRARGSSMPVSELQNRLENLEKHVLAAVNSVIARNRQLEASLSGA